MEFWIGLFHKLRDDGHLDGSVIVKHILQFCFMDLIQVCQFCICIYIVYMNIRGVGECIFRLSYKRVIIIINNESMN